MARAAGLLVSLVLATAPLFADELIAPAVSSDTGSNAGPDTEIARTLIYPTSGGKTASMTTEAMAERLGLQTIEVYSLEFKGVKTFEGIPLRALLEYLDIELGEQLLLVAIDGYQIAFDSSLLLQPDLNALLAFRDLEAAEGLNWELFKHGRHLVNFDPFYLVWAIDNDPLEDPDIARLETLPWPYQMNEIRVAGQDQYAAAAPTHAMGNRAQAGFDLYVKHCIKCHQVRGIGGVLGAAMDRESAMALSLQTELLTDIIWKTKDYMPETKMPDYRDSLARAEVADIVAYIQAIQTAP